MKLEDFEKEVQEIRAENGWRIILEFVGVYSITIEDKESNKPLASTGATSLEGVLIALRLGINHEIWSKEVW